MKTKAHENFIKIRGSFILLDTITMKKSPKTSARVKHQIRLSRALAYQ